MAWCGCSRKGRQCPASSGGGAAGWSVSTSTLYILWRRRSSKAWRLFSGGVYGWVFCAKNWQLRSHCPERLCEQKMILRVHGRERIVRLWDTLVLLRGVWRGRALPIRVLVLVVPGLQLKPWSLLTTDLDLDPRDAVRAYDGRYQIEVNMAEVQALGWGHSQGRRGQGIRRWPWFLSLGQMSLKLSATGVLAGPLPRLHWPWYTRENTVGQVRRRLIEACHPRIFCMKVDRPIRRKLAKAA
jgi:hypothetical protein